MRRNDLVRIWSRAGRPPVVAAKALYGAERRAQRLMLACTESVREHVEGLLTEAMRLRDGDGVPGFVEEEFRAVLRCGVLAGGFARFRCTGCTTERRHDLCRRVRSRHDRLTGKESDTR